MTDPRGPSDQFGSDVPRLSRKTLARAGTVALAAIVIIAGIAGFNALRNGRDSPEGACLLLDERAIEAATGLAVDRLEVDPAPENAGRKCYAFMETGNAQVTLLVTRGGGSATYAASGVGDPLTTAWDEAKWNPKGHALVVREGADVFTLLLVSFERPDPQLKTAALEIAAAVVARLSAPESAR